MRSVNFLKVDEPDGCSYLGNSATPQASFPNFVLSDSGTMRKALLIIPLMLLPWLASATEQPVGFTQADRDRLVRMEAILEQHEKRFESIESRMDRSDSRMDWQFGTLVSAMFILMGFILWDRRTFLKPFQERVDDLDMSLSAEKGRSQNLLAALRELSKTDARVAEVLRTHNLL